MCIRLGITRVCIRGITQVYKKYKCVSDHELCKCQMTEPQYQELLSKDIPHVSTDGVHVAVIAGTSYGASVRSQTNKIFESQ